MAARKRNADDKQGMAGGGFAESPDQDLYETEINRYQETLDRGLGEALERYGFTLYHSLPPARQLSLAQEVGLMRYDTVDHYNMGVLAAERGDLDDAVKQFQKSLELDGTHAEAAYNLAVAYEHLERKPDAINAWSRFLELTQSDEDRHVVEAHLAELRA